MSVAQLMTNTVTIYAMEASTTLDDYGTPIPSEVEISTVCYLEQISAKEVEGLVPTGTYRCFFPPGTDIKADDRVVDSDGLSYRVEGPPDTMYNPRSRLNSHIEAMLTRTAGGLEERGE